VIELVQRVIEARAATAGLESYRTLYEVKVPERIPESEDLWHDAKGKPSYRSKALPASEIGGSSRLVWLNSLQGSRGRRGMRNPAYRSTWEMIRPAWISA